MIECLIYNLLFKFFLKLSLIKLNQSSSYLITIYSGKNSIFFYRTLKGMISSASAISNALSLYINASISSFTFSYDADTSAIMKFRKINDEKMTAIIQTTQNITFYDN